MVYYFNGYQWTLSLPSTRILSYPDTQILCIRIHVSKYTSTFVSMQVKMAENSRIRSCMCNSYCYCFKKEKKGIETSSNMGQAMAHKREELGAYNQLSKS